MGKIFLDFDSSTPRYACTSCYRCTSIMGTSYCSVKNRGCCWYFPKFTLMEIHRMSKSQEGLNTLKMVVNNPGTVLYQYYIHAKGYFDKEGYQEYLKSGKAEDEYNSAPDLEDHTIFFRACPFVKEGYGCTIPARFRSHVCNFFICSEVVNSADTDGSYRKYSSELSSYSKWIHWENAALEHILSENKVNLISNFNKTIEILQSLPLNEYEFPQLHSIDYEDPCPKGA